MSSALEEREEQSSKCFICNMKVTTRSSYNVYCTFMPQREKLLIDVMSKILQKLLNPSQIRSSVLCRRCFTLFDELDQISTRFKKLQSDIIKRYTSTCIDYKDNTFINVVNSMNPTKMIELPLTEKETEIKSLNNEGDGVNKSSNDLNEIVETIINNIQAEEAMDNKDFDISISDSLKDKNVSIDEEVMENINNAVNPLSDIEKPLSETISKVRKRSVGVSYKCEQCDDCFRRATDLKNHCATVHQTSKRYFCSSCNKSYSTKKSYNNHLNKEHTSVGKQINSQDSDLIKLDSDTTDTSQNNIESTVEVVAEYTNDSSENLVIDVKPDFSVDNSLYLEEIVQEGNEDDDFEWKEEDKNNDDQENILEDSSSALDETVTPSSESEKSDKKQTKGRKKRGSSRSGERACLPAIHTCEMCGKKWRTMTELKSHIQSHSTIRPYVCEICGQAYKLKKALDVHIGMHNGIHPFTCEFCHKSFTQKVGLQKHIPIHTGYTRFQCDLCGKRFIHQKSFHIHTMTHTGEKHVKCPQCGLAVLSQSHLKRHLRVHTGERPYACPICGKRFAEKYNMNAHVHIHDNNTGAAPKRNRNHVCQLCGMSYDRKHKLEYHLASTHKKIDNKLTQDLKTEQQQQLELKTEYFQENSHGQPIVSVDNSTIENSDVNFDRKFKLEYHLTSSHNKVIGKLPQDQETDPQHSQKFEHEYFQENSHGHPIITVDNSTAMITVSGVKVPISLDGAPIMVTTLPQQSQNANLVPVPLNLPAGSILTYTSSSSNDNNQPMVDGTQNVYMSQNPVTIQLS